MLKVMSSALGLIYFFSVFFTLTSSALAEKWVEVTATGRDKAFFDSDSAFVDIKTGLVVVTVASWEVLLNDYTYLLNGYDCYGWKEYLIGFKADQGWEYDYDRAYDSQPVASDQTSPGYKTARWACDSRQNLRQDNIHFDFQVDR